MLSISSQDNMFLNKQQVFATRLNNLTLIKFIRINGKNSSAQKCQVYKFQTSLY